MTSGGQDKDDKPVGKAEHTTTLNVSRMYKKGKVVVGNEAEEEMIQIQVPVTKVPMAEVEASSRMTLTTGIPYESVQIGISVRLPCFVEEVEECYKAAKSLVDHQLARETSDIRAYRDSKKKA